jgi:class 3 adenylate cyclase
VRFSPLMRQHVIPHGTYHFARSKPEDEIAWTHYHTLPGLFEKQKMEHKDHQEVRMERKLTAILCADVYGYSRLMGEDEEATLRALSSHRKLIDSLIAQHRGRFVNSAGDSVGGIHQRRERGPVRGRDPELTTSNSPATMQPAPRRRKS